jgi:predicted ester cyclase
MTLLLSSSSGALAQPFSVEEARAIVAPLYEALNEPAKKDVAKLLAKATSPEWLSCSANAACVSREMVVARFQASGDAVPDLRWEILEVLVSGDRVIVRGEASGGPVKTFLGVEPGGRRFKVMSIDVHTIEKGKIVRSYHLEDWAGAMRQLRGS